MKTVGTVCVLTIVSWLRGVFQVLGWLLITRVTLDKSFCSAQVSLLANWGEVSLSGRLCAVLEVQYQQELFREEWLGVQWQEEDWESQWEGNSD